MKNPKPYKLRAPPKVEEIAEMLEQFAGIVSSENRTELIKTAERFASVSKSNVVGCLTPTEMAQRFRDKAANSSQLMRLCKRDGCLLLANILRTHPGTLPGFDLQVRCPPIAL
jgi:hypothetical protein